MSNKPKKIREQIGQVFGVPLGNQILGYGQVVSETECVFFDFLSETNDVNINQIIKSDVIFRITIDANIIRDQIWPVVGIASLPPILPVNNHKYTYDYIGKFYKIWHTPILQEKATPKQIRGMEFFMSWNHQLVEQRLKDYFSGRPNFYVEYNQNRHNPNFETDIVKFYKQYGYDFQSENNK